MQISDFLVQKYKRLLYLKKHETFWDIAFAHYTFLRYMYKNKVCLLLMSKQMLYN